MVPQSGIYFVGLSILLENALRNVQYGIRLMSSLAGHSISSWTTNYDIDKELSLSANLRLTVGERLLVTCDNEFGNVTILPESAFSMQLIGQVGVLPSFLARTLEDERIGQNRESRIANWKAYHKSLTSFSSAEGIFVPVVSSNYVCSLNLVLEYVFGIVEVTFKTNQRTLFTIKRQFRNRETTITVHASKIFALREKEIFQATLKGYNASIIVSKATTFSCALIGEDDKVETLSILSAHDILFENQNWLEVSLWQEVQTSSSFRLLSEEGKVFFNANLAFIGLSLSVTTFKSDDITVALIPGGVSTKEGTGIYKTLEFKGSATKMIAMTGLIKTVDDSYISLIITSKLGSKMRISNGEMKIILKEPHVPMMLLPLINSSVLNETITKWQAIYIDNEVRQKPFRIQSSYWNIKDKSFSPKEAGIYYISASFQAALINTTVTPKRAFEAKVFLKRNNHKKGKEMMYGIQNLREEPRTLSLAGAINLDSNDKLFLMFRCQDCILSASSGISAVLLSKSFNMEGFSTKLSASQNISVKESVYIDSWSWHFADFFLTNSFNADTGVYEAPHTGVFLIICTLIVQNIQKQGSVSLRIDITNSTASYINESLPVSGDGPESMTLTVPVKLNQGQAVVLVLSAINSHNITVINGSKFSITSLMHGSSTLPPGFTLSLRNLMAFSFRWSSPLKDWSQDAIAGAFSKKSEALFEFNERQGEMIIRKEAVLLLNIIAHVNVDRGSQLTLNVRINEEIVERVLSVTGYVDSVEYLKISSALFVKNKDRITVEVQCLNRRSTYYVLKKTMMSAVFLSSTSTKPGLTLGVRKSLVGQVNGKKAFRCKLNKFHYIFSLL